MKFIFVYLLSKTTTLINFPEHKEKIKLKQLVDRDLVAII